MKISTNMDDKEEIRLEKYLYEKNAVNKFKMLSNFEHEKLQIKFGNNCNRKK